MIHLFFRPDSHQRHFIFHPKHSRNHHENVADHFPLISIALVVICFLLLNCYTRGSHPDIPDINETSFFSKIYSRAFRKYQSFLLPISHKKVNHCNHPHHSIGHLQEQYSESLHGKAIVVNPINTPEECDLEEDNHQVMMKENNYNNNNTSNENDCINYHHHLQHNIATSQIYSQIDRNNLTIIDNPIDYSTQNQSHPNHPKQNNYSDKELITSSLPEPLTLTESSVNYFDSIIVYNSDDNSNSAQKSI